MDGRRIDGTRPIKGLDLGGPSMEVLVDLLRAAPGVRRIRYWHLFTLYGCRSRSRTAATLVSNKHVRSILLLGIVTRVDLPDDAVSSSHIPGVSKEIPSRRPSDRILRELQ